MKIRTHIRSLTAWVVANIKGVGVLAAAAFCALTFYTYHRVGDNSDNFVNIVHTLDEHESQRYNDKLETQKALDDLEMRLVRDIRDKQEACRVLETIASREYSHTYCKDESR